MGWEKIRGGNSYPPPKKKVKISKNLDPKKWKFEHMYKSISISESEKCGETFCIFFTQRGKINFSGGILTTHTHLWDVPTKSTPKGIKAGNLSVFNWTVLELPKITLPHSTYWLAVGSFSMKNE